MKVNYNVIKSIFGSTAFKLSSAAISFITVPLLLKTLGTNNYAVWVTLTALLSWLNLFDFGSGYSLKNKVTESRASNDNEHVAVLIAGTMQFYILMSILLMIIFIISTFFVNVFQSHLQLAYIIYVPIILSFPFTLGHFIIQGIKKFNLFNSILFSQNAVWLIILMIYKSKIFEVDIYKLAFFYSALYVIANFIIISISLKNLHFKLDQIFNFRHFIASKKSLLTGTKFFVLQVSSLFLYSMGNILTYSNLSLKNVAQYDTVNKVFLLGMTIFNVVISVFWTEVSHAKALKDKVKLNKIYKQLLLLALAFSIGTCLVTFFVPVLISLWTNKAIMISNIKDVYPFALLVIIQCFSYCGAVFLNAFEKLKGQIILSITASVLMIPLCRLLFSLEVGIGTVPLSAAILTLPTLVFVIYKSKVCINEISL
ncbi:lipopolysaccharide biosynthesis protein [Mucilaginibacter pocheonensis]|uniref:O-antigen/teichoic acid export membrane protein n=1 Tax=Mucilaginibacter pocheonensis TaxID=398050 RepID=A0ABU1T8N1_9SPHI|nr:MATE family efflux transporter [Mucilaginibacter pocheonensis]MDR6941175.1 O-antigen/teichoic acid export membrane protein [Mucilaginibacter pocheonensis]